MLRLVCMYDMCHAASEREKGVAAVQGEVVVVMMVCGPASLPLPPPQDPDVGYVQGMNFLVGFLLHFFESEAEVGAPHAPSRID